MRGSLNSSGAGHHMCTVKGRGRREEIWERGENVTIDRRQEDSEQE